MLVAYQNVPLDFMRALGADLLPAPGRRNEHLFHGLNRYRVEARLERVAPVLGRALDVLRDASDLSKNSIFSFSLNISNTRKFASSTYRSTSPHARNKNVDTPIRITPDLWTCLRLRDEAA